jgi:hypothetical protein
MVHQAIKVEEQLKRKGFARRGQPMTTTSPWKTATKRDEQLQDRYGASSHKGGGTIKMEGIC